MSKLKNLNLNNVLNAINTFQVKIDDWESNLNGCSDIDTIDKCDVKSIINFEEIIPSYFRTQRDLLIVKNTLENLYYSFSDIQQEIETAQDENQLTK